MEEKNPWADDVTQIFATSAKISERICARKMSEMENEVAARRAKVAELEAQLAARDAEIAQLKGKVKVECVWVYAHGFDNEFYFETEEEAYEWWEWYKTETCCILTIT